MTKKTTARHATPADSSAAVDAYMATLDHPFAPQVQQLRALLRDVDPAVAEGIKWNAPSWRTHEYFATTHLRGRRLALVLHLGAKARALPADGLRIADPAGLLKWLGSDRAMVEFADAADLAARGPALQALLRDWIRHV